MELPRGHQLQQQLRGSMKAVFNEIFLNVTKKQKYMFLLAMLLIGGLIYFVSQSKDYPQDNEVEEVIEEVIEDQLSVDVDLSPESEEPK